MLFSFPEGGSLTDGLRCEGPLKSLNCFSESKPEPAFQFTFRFRSFGLSGIFGKINHSLSIMLTLSRDRSPAVGVTVFRRSAPKIIHLRVLENTAPAQENPTFVLIDWNHFNLSAFDAGSKAVSLHSCWKLRHWELAGARLLPSFL
jgi:hypothetical protein